ncbi:titin [Megalops cyprinoides]|uniref:titin n=1 Tax=Megalops cyprinoides TaxID=118141 RepID=UPI0018643EF2|nr:titin [Megalops cyprinoides]
MEQEGSMDFKALRAKFQEEAALKQMKNKPAIPEKPKLIPPPGARVSLLSSINSAVENKMPVIPRVVFRDAKPGPEAKRPLSLPPSLKPKDPVRDSNFNTELLDHQQKKEGDVVKQAFKDGKLPLVLPVPPKVEKPDPAPPAKSLTPKKKAFLPFKSKTSKSGKESPENNEGPANTSPVAKQPAPTVEVTEVEAPKLENGNLPHEAGLGSEPQSPNSERAETPPSADEGAEEASTGSRTPPCDQRVLNALEKAKKKFSPIHSLSQSRPNSASPVNGDQSNVLTPNRPLPELPPIDYEDPSGDVPNNPPTATHQATAACVSPDEIDGPSHRQSSPTLDGTIEHGTGDLQPSLQAIISPPRKPLPDLDSLGPSPEKPPRPPFVDLSSYQTTAPEAHVESAPEVLTLQNLALEAPEIEATECEAVEFEVPPSEVPELPEFGTSQPEAQEAYEDGAPEGGVLETPDLGTSDLASVDLGPPDLNPPDVTPLDDGAQDLGALDLDVSDLRAPDLVAPDVEVPESGVVELGNSELEVPPIETPEGDTSGTVVLESLPASPNSSVNKESEQQSGSRQDSHYESCDNVYEDVEAVSKFRRGQNTRKRKGPPKNPYADSQPASEETHKTSWFFKNERKVSPEAHDDKELKKKEKQRLEKEKKEQKEREKKENEMKKKFKITGQEEAMYQARVTKASKGRKNDLPVKSGDFVSIIRTTNCPKGKWLARDNNNKYGYVSVKSVELDIKEMVELGKKASQAAGRSAATEGETASVGSRSSNHYPLSTGSFTDDSEEWTCDDEDTLSPTENKGHSRTVSMPEMLCQQTDVEHTFNDGISEDSNAHARHEALQKLATFFQHQRETTEIVAENNTEEITEAEPSLLFPAVEPAYLGEQEEDLQLPDMEILPPPELYADSVDDGSAQPSLS